MNGLHYTQDQVRDLLVDVGFGPKQAHIGSAIALCEAPVYDTSTEPMSDFGLVGDQALANDTWGASYSGFQIRSLRADKGTGRPRDEEQLIRPRFAARSAHTIYKSSGWEAWSTYTSGMYRAYLQDLYPPAPGTYVVLAGDTLSGIADKLGGFIWEDLARVNNLHAPYAIYIGQTLTLPPKGTP